MPKPSHDKVRNYIANEWRASSASEYMPLENPATGESLGSVPMGTARDVDEAVAAAKAAFPAWRETPAPVRARYLFDSRNVMEKHYDELLALCTAEHGKTLEETQGRRAAAASRTSRRRAGMPSLMMGQALEQIATGIDCVSVRQPMGVFAAIAPYNFPSMVPLWFLPYAIATGNTFVVKPSEQVPLLAASASSSSSHDDRAAAGRREHGQRRQGRRERDLRAHGHRGRLVRRLDAGRASTSTQRCGATGKRVQALGGAKNFTVVMPTTATGTRPSPNIVDSASTAAPGSGASRRASSSASATAYERAREAPRRRRAKASRSATASSRA